MVLTINLSWQLKIKFAMATKTKNLPCENRNYFDMEKINKLFPWQKWSTFAMEINLKNAMAIQIYLPCYVVKIAMF